MAVLSRPIHVFIKPRQAVEYFIAPDGRFIKAKNNFIKPRGPVDHFIARRLFYRPIAVLSRRRQPVDHFIHFIAPNSRFIKVNGRFIKPRQPVDHFIARRPLYLKKLRVDRAK